MADDPLSSALDELASPENRRHIAMLIASYTAVLADDPDPHHVISLADDVISHLHSEASRHLPRLDDTTPTPVLRHAPYRRTSAPGVERSDHADDYISRRSETTPVFRNKCPNCTYLGMRLSPPPKAPVDLWHHQGPSLDEASIRIACRETGQPRTDDQHTAEAWRRAALLDLPIPIDAARIYGIF